LEVALQEKEAAYTEKQNDTLNAHFSESWAWQLHSNARKLARASDTLR
jgi:hypothetical protein